jgi:phosphatidate cytidylyltransferase
MVFLILVAQSSDVLQYVWGKIAGRRKIAVAGTSDQASLFD